MTDALERARWIAVLICSAFLFFGLYLIFRPFLAVFAWSVIVVFTTWPLYSWLTGRLPNRPAFSALIMTLLLALIMLVVLIPILRGVSLELETALGRAETLLEEPRFQELVAAAEKVPIVGSRLVRVLEDLKSREFDRSIAENGGQLIGVATTAARGVIEFLLKFALFIFVIFFIYRDGKEIGNQLQRALMRLGGQRFDNLLNAAKGTLKATVYGMLLTALAQGFLAGIGYSVAGAPVPLLFGVATTLLSLIPFGPPIIYVPVTVLVLVNGAGWLTAIGLLLWCVLVVSSIDNILRPIFIGQKTNISVLLIFVGVIGGTMSFGLIGIFLGPIIIALTKALWDEWVEQAN